MAELTQEGVGISPILNMTIQPYIHGAVTMYMDQAAGADDWGQEPWELLAAQPWGPSMASSHQHPPMCQLLGYLLSQKEMPQ